MVGTLIVEDIVGSIKSGATVSQEAVL